MKDAQKIDIVLKRYIPSMFKRREVYAKLADLKLNSESTNEIFKQMSELLKPRR